jgi:hypothetical protein
MKPRHIIPLFIIGLAVLAIGSYGLIEQRKIMIRLASDNDARAHNITGMSLVDANGNEIKTKESEEFNRTIRKIIEGNEMKFALAKYESMARPWILLGGLLMAYSLFMLYKLKTTEPNQSLQTTTMAVTDAAAQPPRQP